jgi:predicted alpha/beta superfamily hydrolase
MDRTYRTRTDAANTALGGSSLGGLISLWVGLKRSDVFGKLALLSPSVWWDEKAILKAVAKKLPLKLWVDIGTSEGDSALPDARLLRDALKEKGWKEGSDLAYHEFEGAGHNEASWAARFDQVLLFLFPR